MKLTFTRILLVSIASAAFASLVQNTAFAADRTVSIRDDFFSPRNLTIQPGDTVTWVHQGADNHTTTSSTGIWNSGVLHNGESFSFTFTNLGNFPYFCQVHGQSMSGSVAVSDTPPIRDLFLVNLTGKSKTTNAQGAIVMTQEQTKNFLADCAEENGREARDLALVYDVDADAIVAVDRADGTTVCVVVTFVGGVNLTAPDGHRERQAFVIEEDSDETNGSMTATEHSTRGNGGELVKLSLRGTIQFGRAAYEDEPSKIFTGTFTTTRKFVPTNR